MDDLQRQLRIALFAFLIIVPVGTIGFMILEGWSFIDSLYVTVITLSTIGYGDLTPLDPYGRLFTIVLAVLGLSAFAFAGQAFIQFFTSPLLRLARTRRITQRKVRRLSNHYIICGMGEMVDRTVDYLLQSANVRRDTIRARQYRPIDGFLERILGDDETGHFLWLSRPIKSFSHSLINLFQTQSTILDILVVVTQDEEYAEGLRNSGLLVIKGDPTVDEVLIDAGIERAQAMMVMLNDDTETLLSVLTAHSIAPTTHITAAVLDDDLGRKIVRAGATNVLNPFDTSGQFLNNATFRPAVNAFFNGLMFDHNTDYRLTQLSIRENSPWVGKTIGSVNFRTQYDGGVIGIRYDNSIFGYAPSDQHILEVDDVLLVVAPATHIQEMQQDSKGNSASKTRLTLWQPLPRIQAPLRSDKTYSLVEAEKAIEGMSKHFIICGNDRIARSAIARLDPTRPFVIISNDNTLTSELIKRGFRVVHGNPSSEETLLKAGVKRAQAIMVALDKKADSVLTIITSRAMNKRLLITTTANTDDMIEKLELSGADRVVSPFHVAAQFVLLTTTRPEISGFVNAVLYNYQTGLETTEIYMEHDSVWIGKTISELKIRKDYDAGVIGIRQADRKTFMYAPPSDYVIREHEVLIIVTPMKHSDTLRDAAHGGVVHAPSTLRSKVLQSQRFTPDEIQELLKQAKRPRK
ncbi:MAG: NAD-binding protein [Phototrophicaceae bacterium]